jgi:hypothetical protein
MEDDMAKMNDKKMGQWRMETNASSEEEMEFGDEGGHNFKNQPHGRDT